MGDAVKIICIIVKNVDPHPGVSGGHLKKPDISKSVDFFS